MSPPGRSTGIVLTGSATTLLVVLFWVATRSTLAALIAVLLAALLLALTVIGAERLGTLALLLAYATAPMYKGLAPSPGSPVTATDALFVIGFGLLVFRIIRGRPRIPATYLVGIGTVFVTGLLAAAYNVHPGGTLLPLAFWMTASLALPLAMSLWNPPHRMISWMAGAYVFGQLVDTVLAVIYNRTDRWTGLSTHPNYFAEGALLSCALLIFLHGRVAPRHRWLVWCAGAVCAVGVINSGSRAATVVLAVLILLIPLLERTTMAFAAVAGIAGLAAFAIAFLLQRSGEESAISRLAGAGTSFGSDLARSHGLADGWHRFLSHPFIGNGMADLFDIHNNLLEVAVSVGVVGFFGYLLVMWSLGRIVLTDLPLRRLGYVVLAYLGFGATVPSLYDRSIWSVVSLAILAYQVPRAGSILTARQSSPSQEPTPKAAIREHPHAVVSSTPTGPDPADRPQPPEGAARPAGQPFAVGSQRAGLPPP